MSLKVRLKYCDSAADNYYTKREMGKCYLDPDGWPGNQRSQRKWESSEIEVELAALLLFSALEAPLISPRLSSARLTINLHLLCGL